jgi:hypothetical protein
MISGNESRILKHLGYVINTGKRCVLLFMELPEKKNYALIAEIDSLPERIFDPLMSLVYSNEGQNCKNFAELLARRFMPDNNIPILHELHNLGYIRAEPVENIMVTPVLNKANTHINLKKLLDEIKKLNNENPDVVEDLKKTNVEPDIVENNLKNLGDGKTSLSSRQVAENLLVQAKLLEEDALRLRKKAKDLCPELFINNEIIENDNGVVNK